MGSDYSHINHFVKTAERARFSEHVSLLERLRLAGHELGHAVVAWAERTVSQPRPELGVVAVNASVNELELVPQELDYTLADVA